MRKSLNTIKTTLFFLFIHSAFVAQSQSNNSSHHKDSIDYEFIYGFAGDSSISEYKNNTNFKQVFENPRLLELSSGMNFLNVLRGQTPNLIINPQFATGNPISPDYLFVLDGIPYNSDHSYFSNLNTFDFDQIVVLSAFNGASEYGAVGGNGGIVLKRKSGRGIETPTLEFNTFLTGGWVNQKDLFIQSEDKLHLSNALSFAQDFGKVDTRISFNYSVLPEGDADFGTKAKSVKMNTGIAFSSKLDGRIVFERYNHNTVKGKFFPPSFPDGSSDLSTLGLSLEYKPLKWISISAQGNRDNFDHFNRFDIPKGFNYFNSKTRDNQTRKLIKATLQTKHAIGNVVIRPGISLQNDNTEFSPPSGSPSLIADNYQIKSIWGTINNTYKEMLSLDLSYRSEDLNHQGNRKSEVYALGLGWVFTKSLDLGDVVNFGRLRNNFGHRDGNVTHPFAQANPENRSSLAQRFYSNQAGMDLSMLKNRIQISYNHYLVFDKSFRETTIEYGNIVIQYLDYANDAYIEGDELIIGAYPLGNKKWYTRLTWNRPGSKLPGFVSDWFGTIYLMRDWNGFQLSTIISYRKGGQTFNNMREYSASSIDLRDLSISHKAFFNKSRRFGLREITVALTGRNLWHIGANGIGNPELSSVNNGMYNSFTLNIFGKLN